MINPLTYFKVSSASVPAVIEYAWNAWADKYARRRSHPTASRIGAISLCVAWNVALKWHFKVNEQTRRRHGIPIQEDMCSALVLVSQPERSHCCGQCCVAMVAGVSLEAAKKAVGKNGRTSTRVLRKGLINLGLRPRRGKLRPIYGDLSKLPETCILKTVTPWRQSGWHWVLKYKKKIYCPSRGVFQMAEYEIETDNKITSYLEIFTDGR